MKRKELDTPSASAAGAPQEDEAEEVSDEQRDTKRVLPGQSVLEDIGEGTVKIGAGLVRSDSDVVASVSGPLTYRHPRKFWVATCGKRYLAAVNDTVIGIITDKAAEAYRVNIGGSTAANLSALAFDGATKRNKPNLSVGSLVFARVESVDPDVDPELTCKASEAGVAGGQKKDWVTGQGMYGELKHGTIVQVDLLLCRKLLSPSCPVLVALGAALPFELAVGMNGCVWINSGSLSHTIAVANAIQRSQSMPDHAIPRFVKKLLEKAI